MIRILYAGTPDFALPVFEALLKREEVSLSCVLTKKDAPKGRGLKLQPSQVKTMALANHIPVFEPTTLRKPESDELFSHLSALKIDLAIVVAYGLLIPKRFLEIPRLGWVNVHGSLLPKYRGAAPIQRAIMDNQNPIGITLMKLNQGMDEGEMLLKKEHQRAPYENVGIAFEALATLGAKAIEALLDELLKSSKLPKGTAQEESMASHAKKIEKSERWLDFSCEASHVASIAAALDPNPGARASIKSSQKLPKNWTLRNVLGIKKGALGASGTIVSLEGGLWVSCVGGSVGFASVQPEGKKPLNPLELQQGYSALLGACF